MQSSTYVVGPVQADGRHYITETHVDDGGGVHTYEWLGDPALADAVLAERAIRVQAEFDARVIAAQGAVAINRITPQALMARLTDVEEATVELASTDVPGADQMTRLQAAGLRAKMKKLSTAQFVDLDRRDAGSAWAGLKMLEAAGLLAAGRADEIINAPIQPIEMAR